MSNQESKGIILSTLKSDLIGPRKEQEILHSYPSDVYLTGILFPQDTDQDQEDRDQLQAEGTVSGDAEYENDQEVSLASVKKPASAGLSFAVSSNQIPVINIKFNGAYYEKINEKNGEMEWKRIPLESDIENLSLDFQSKDFFQKETNIKGLHIHVRTSNWDDKLLVTVAMINNNKSPKEYERQTIEKLTLFQTKLSVTCESGTKFEHKPIKSSSKSDDSMMANLLYRSVFEYAVGHTCSATWDIKDSNDIDTVSTTWLPVNTVKAMSNKGDSEFEKLGKESRVFSTSWVAHASKMDLLAELEKLPVCYEEWIEKKIYPELINLDDEELHQARKHIKSANSVISRVRRSIQLIKNSENDLVLKAFKLANFAINIQRKWAKPDEEDLVWRPFQLYFILLVLSSLVDEDSDDRKVADLLWFPTGGGKTEAYLGLVAFIIFFRRLNYGDEGAGVSVIMRYTLRLLTIQQFERATNLICACEAIRLNEFTIPDLEIDLGEIPISIGLWVGDDSTPNKKSDAKSFFEGSKAKDHSPEQISNCPVHSNTPLKWTIDATSDTTMANCNNKDCIWHTRPLPIFTVDEDLYDAKPSLVIGTIDKFAQIVRNPSTSMLFGNHTNFRSPDFIIQDELHLISGPLGTLSALYEISIDKLCENNGVSPKIIASTATIRQASEQIKALYNRDAQLFPPPMLDANNSGFAISVDNSRLPGRTYIGLTTAGRSAKFSLQAVSASLLQSPKNPTINSETIDNFWTLVIYFNSLRELGGALVLMQDDTLKSIRQYAQLNNQEERKITLPWELTSRIKSDELKRFLKNLELTQGSDQAADVVLATNMISVGVDVPRLGLMLVNGQPKTMSEYIQATSRVGRDMSREGGIVVSIYNNMKPRDRSHFETFNTWHNALYREVEASSVTPFSPRARQRAIHAQLVALARNLIDGLHLDDQIKDVENYEGKLLEFKKYIVDRCDDIDKEESHEVENLIQSFIDDWLSYSSSINRYWNDFSPNRSLLVSAEKVAEIKSKKGRYSGIAKATPNSMRNVEPSTMFKIGKSIREGTSHG